MPKYMLYKWFSTVDGLIKKRRNRLQNIVGNPHIDLAKDRDYPRSSKLL